MPWTRSSNRRILLLELVALASVAFVPLLLTKPGMVAADTKQYLYLDPGRLMLQAISMWNPSVAGGTVTHQQIGYLLPQGPFYWLFAHLDVPVWVAQRLWMGALLFAAGAGVRYALRVLGLTGCGVVVAAAMYELSPYVMQYIERISAILMPWAGLGWMLGFTALAIRRGGWRYPALFALVVALTGGTNATSLIYVCLAPALYILYTAMVGAEAGWRRCLAVAGKIALLSVLVSLWWIDGLAVEGTYGINVLKFTETVPAVASTSLASEVLRGLGYWYFYGSDRLGPWLRSAVSYEEDVWLIAVGFLLPTLAVVGAAVTRWRVRAYFLLLILVGLVLSVGTHPFTNPSELGRGLRAFMTGTTAGFALRSTDRATPLLILGLAAMLGAGLSALQLRLGRRHAVPIVTALAVGALVLLDAAPFLSGLAVDPYFDRAEKLPSYYSTAASYLNSTGSDTRVWIEPGDDFADYTFGNTVDPVWPGLLNVPTIQRQQLIDGSYPTANLLSAFDLQLQQGTYEPATLAPIARLLSAGDVVLQSDYKFWHFNTPRPQETWALFDPPPTGIGHPLAFGKAVPNVAPPGFRFIDEEALSERAAAPWPPPVAVFPVSHSRPIYRAEPAGSPLVLDGDGNGLVAAAAAGLLADNPTVFYAGSLDGDATLRSEVMQPGATLVLTDTNRKDLMRWASVRDNVGETLTAGPEPSEPDPTAQPLVLFEHTPPSDQSVAYYSEARYVAASAYGNPVTFTPESRPWSAFDGNLATAWTVAAFSSASGNWLQVRFDHPITEDHLNLVQALGGAPNRWITKLTITFDGGHSLTENLARSSRTPTGQTVRFPRRTFSTIRFTIDSTTWHQLYLTGASGVGFSEIRIPGVNIGETIVMPSDLLRAAGATSLAHRLVVILTRARVGPFPPRTDPEQHMVRSFYLPTGRSFALGGTARVSALIPDTLIDTLLGGPRVFGGAVLSSSGRLPGDLNARAVMAFDTNPATFWGPGFDAAAQVGAWIQANLTHEVSFDSMNLQVIADGRHSVPTVIRITSNRGADVLLHLPPVADHKAVDSVVTIPLRFPKVSGSVIRVTVEAVRQVKTINWYSEMPIVQPFAIASLGIPGIRFRPEQASAHIPAVCRADLLTVDGKPVWLRVSGTVAAAEAGSGLQVRGCGPDANGLHLGPGQHTLVTGFGQVTGFNVDRLVLDSAAGGGALPALSDGSPPPVAGTLAGGGLPAEGAPSVRTVSSDSTHATLRVTGATGPFWLVLGQSLNNGWVANIAGGSSLGHSVLIDGYANGWFVRPRSGAFTVDLTWTPQSSVDVALVLSALAILGCLVLALVPFGRRRTPVTSVEGPLIDLPLSDGSQAGSRPDWRSSIPLGLVPGLAAGVIAGLLLPAEVAIPTGAVIGIVVALAPRYPRARLGLLASGVVGTALAGGLTVYGQATQHFHPGDDWPGRFATAGVIAFIAVVAISADALLDALGRRSRRRVPELSDRSSSDDENGPTQPPGF